MVCQPTRPQFSARKRVTLAQMAAFLILALLPCAEFRLFAGQRPLDCGQRRAWLVFSLRYRLAPVLSVFGSSLRKIETLEDPGDADLPTYSVLVPVFRETSVLSQLLRGLSCLNYPVEKLEIKIIVEEFDTNLRRALREI